MDKKKLLLAVLLFAALIFAGIILPLLLRKDVGMENTDMDSPVKKLPKDEAESVEVECLKFDALTDYMAGTKVTELNSLFPSYLQKAGKTGISSVTFLSEQSSYPNESEVRLMFELSDQTTLPVYCDRNGRFLFGEERMQLMQDDKTYSKPKDDKLPKLSTSEIEPLQEGGYPDTGSAKGTKAPHGQKKGE
ncbi:DUF5038 domain-containing protein [Blautia coccoides]|mgnify:CR=1 FL=1|uniref:DUF5038 domain-containing protein n=1 Tax=Blautia hominis TaxID=2025493 RepID=A0ABQ0B3L8_9FIRM|nr:DUF5038 domain-containing protein [Blautia coccoides]MCQ4640719.1 DUF5038 domain-containing protein [Blautia coccoides]